MQDLINLIEELTEQIFNGNSQAVGELSKKMNEMIWEVIPGVIAIYSRPEMSDYSQDALLWPIVVENVMAVSETDDVFKLVDVLYYELRGNLIELMGIMNNVGIQM